MTGWQLNGFLRRLATTVGRDLGLQTDAALLEGYAARRDEAAFAALVGRHGPTVLGVCRRLLRHEPDVEDAFQATFLTLARKAAAIGRGEAVGSWLYKVAYRVALAARAANARRADRERRGVAPAVPPAQDLVWADLRPVLDEEVGRLPAKYRAAFVLCHLRGLTNAAAARELRCPVGTVLSRLAWARERLRSRLTRRGVTLAALVTAAVAPDLVASTMRAVVTGAAPDSVSTLTKGVLRMLFWTRVQMVAGWLVAAIAVGATAASLLAYQASGPGAGPVRQLPLAAPKPEGPEAGQEGAGDLKLLQGNWAAVSGERDGQELPPGEVAKVRVLVKDAQAILCPGGEWAPLDLRLDTARTPRVLNATPSKGPERGKTVPMIYQVTNDTLTLCWDSKNGQAVPEGFATKPGSGLIRFTFQREEAAVKPPRARNN